MNTTIYCFLCPKTNAPVYVGKTTMILSRRISNHCGHAKRKPKSPFHVWLSNQTIEPKVLVLDRLPFEQSSKAETRWIIRFQKRFPLLNVHYHSSGNPGCGRVVWTEYLLSRLGKQTDTSIAEMAGCNRQTVAYRRELLGIPRFPDPHIVKTEVFLDLVHLSRLGKEPDYIIAKDLGVSKFVISKHRKRLLIPSYAEATGNNGKIRAGEPHRRWK